jgi:hypothetical protein
MIEMQHQGVSQPAVDTGVTGEILQDPGQVLGATRVSPYERFGNVFGSIAFVVGALVLAVARPAYRLKPGPEVMGIGGRWQLQKASAAPLGVHEKF